MRCRGRHGSAAVVPKKSRAQHVIHTLISETKHKLTREPIFHLISDMSIAVHPGATSPLTKSNDVEWRWHHP